MFVFEDDSTTETDEYYDNILNKQRYYVTSDIHGDVILFIRFLVGVYNDLNGTVRYSVGPSKGFNYYNIPNLDYSDQSVKYDIKNIFCINDKKNQRSVKYDKFIKSLNDLLIDNNTCIILNGDIFDNHIPYNETYNTFEWLKNFNKNGNSISLSYDSTINVGNNESTSKIIEISIIYDIIVLLNKKGNVLFLVGNHELNMLKYYNYVSSTIESKRTRQEDYIQYNPETEQYDEFDLLQSTRGGGVKDKNCILRLLYDFIKTYGYIELYKPNQLHIQHTANDIILNKNKVDFYLNNLNDIDDKLTVVYDYNKLCVNDQDTYHIYGHTPNIPLFRCEYNNKPTGYKYFFIDRQYSIHEIIKNINSNYDLISCYDKTREYKLNKIYDCEVIRKLFKTLIKTENKPGIIIKLYCLIYYNCIKYKNIIITDNLSNQINNKSDIDLNETEIIELIDKIYTKLLFKQCKIYYCLNNKNHVYNMYNALIFSLCHRFKDMFKITNLELEKSAMTTTINGQHLYYELCNYIDFKAACYEESESSYTIRTITY